ncbi:hypothetical protein BDZ97DRAFT_1826668 [Flammula alnicola]|nr:hypothetical protein BDZ97DRAFT_1826668 [Flammula alnicola]
MQIKFAIMLSAVSAALLAAPVLAQSVTYEGYADTTSCSGSAFGCTDGGAICCTLPTGFGYSVQFDNLPSGSQGQGYTDGACTSFLFSVFGPGTKCWNGGGSRASTMNWFHSPQGRRGVVAARSTAKANCSTPAYFKYEDASGETKTIAVPAGKNAAQNIADLYMAKNYTALAQYQAY